MKSFSIVGTPEEVRAKTRLEYLREQIEKECISYAEIAELQSLVEYIEPGDVVLLEWAEVPENARKCVCGEVATLGDFCKGCGDMIPM